MTPRALALTLALLPATLAAHAQDQGGWTPDDWTVAPLEDWPTLDDVPGIELETIEVPEQVITSDPEPEPEPPVQVARAQGGAVLRGLDKVSGATVDLALAPGETGRIGRLSVTLGECRYPVDNPASDAFAYLTLAEQGADAPAFSGWMLASSPALNAFDHPRYDVWVLRCNNS